MVVVHQPVQLNAIIITHIYKLFHILRKTEKARVRFKGGAYIKNEYDPWSIFNSVCDLLNVPISTSA